jgi:membrane-associated phospholipid phosphatase
VKEESDYRLLLGRSLGALCVCAVLVALCYFFVDRPFAWFVHEHRTKVDYALIWLTEVPPLVQAWAVAVLAAVMVRRAWGPLGRGPTMLLAGCVALILADQFRESLSYVFGRYWPDTWINNNPSYITDGAYGFHPFHGGTAYGSFPSGHMARTTAFAAAAWIAYPGWRWACAAVTLAEAAGLLGMNYHFVGDVVAGGFLGALVGVFTAKACGLGNDALPASMAP